MHRASVFLFLLLLLLMFVIAIRAIGVNCLYLCADAYRERNCTNENNSSMHAGCGSVVAAVSTAAVCTNAGGTPAATVKIRDCGLRFFRREPAERERKGSAVRSAQRMNALRAVRCQAKVAQAPLANARAAKTVRRENRQQKNWRCRAPSPWLQAM